MKPVSGKDMVKILIEKGFSLDRIKGSHYIMKKEGHDFSITVPVHGNRDLKRGTQLCIIKSAGLVEDDL